MDAHRRTAPVSRRLGSTALLVALGLGLALADQATAQSLRGLVLERDSDRPVPLATLLMIDAEGDTIATSLSSEEGFFMLQADDDGEYSIVADALGYRAVVLGPYDLDDDDDRVVQVTLAPSPVQLRGLVVDAGEPELRGLAATGFYDRAALGEGHYMFPGQIAASRERWTAQLFWEMPAEVAVVREAGRGPWDNRVQVRSLSSPSLYCSPRIFIDGIWIQNPALAPGDRIGDWQSLSDMVPKDDLIGVEVYLENAIPDRFVRALELDDAGNPTSCGVVLLWTVAYAG